MGLTLDQCREFLGVYQSIDPELEGPHRIYYTSDKMVMVNRDAETCSLWFYQEDEFDVTLRPTKIYFGEQETIAFHEREHDRIVGILPAEECSDFECDEFTIYITSPDRFPHTKETTIQNYLRWDMDNET